MVDGRLLIRSRCWRQIAALRPGTKGHFELRRGKDTMGLKVEMRARRPAIVPRRLELAKINHCHQLQPP